MGNFQKGFSDDQLDKNDSIMMFDDLTEVPLHIVTYPDYLFYYYEHYICIDYYTNSYDFNSYFILHNRNKDKPQ